MIAALERAHAQGDLDLAGVDLQALRRKAWVVYAKRPFGGPEQVIRYLGQYTHRVGIANQRLVALDARGVTFQTKNGKSVTLPPAEMLARFVQHILPLRFVKIRHLGLHAACHATTKLELARQRLEPLTAPTPPLERTHDDAALLLALTGVDLRRCTVCQEPAVVRAALSETRARAPPKTA